VLISLQYLKWCGGEPENSYLATMFKFEFPAACRGDESAKRFVPYYRRSVVEPT
jgi:hypothetical protein